MSYGSAADDEGVLSYSVSKPSSSGVRSSASNLHSSVSISMPPNSTSSSFNRPTSPNPISNSSSPIVNTMSNSNNNGATDDATATLEDERNHLEPTVTAPSILGMTSSGATDRVMNYARMTWSECRPWGEFYSTAAISIPHFASLSDRFSTNLHLYRANYQVIAAFWLVTSFLGAIPSFLTAALLFFLLERWASRSALRNGGKLSHRATIFTAFAVLIIVWLTGISSHILYSLAFSALFISAHAALHEPSVVESEIATV